MEATITKLKQRMERIEAVSHIPRIANFITSITVLLKLHELQLEQSQEADRELQKFIVDQADESNEENRDHEDLPPNEEKRKLMDKVEQAAQQLLQTKSKMNLDYAIAFFEKVYNIHHRHLPTANEVRALFNPDERRHDGTLFDEELFRTAKAFLKAVTYYDEVTHEPWTGEPMAIHDAKYYVNDHAEHFKTLMNLRKKNQDGDLTLKEYLALPRTHKLTTADSHLIQHVFPKEQRSAKKRELQKKREEKRRQYFLRSDKKKEPAEVITLD